MSKPLFTLFLLLGFFSPHAHSDDLQNAAQAQREPQQVGTAPNKLEQATAEPLAKPKRAFVGEATKEYVFARYVEDWITKVERVGMLNYPEAARSQGLYGSLTLTVSIFADGRLESVELNRSSGSRILDAAAVKIVELASPFSPFPDDMRNKIDVLSITRTWTFTRSDQFVGTD